MADILPKYNPGETAPNWTGASQKPDASTYRADKSLETLFSGVGDLIGQATQTGYNAVTNKIKEQWNSVFDPVRDAQGVGPATQAAPVGLNTPAEGLDASGKKVGGIPSAATESMAEKAQKLAAAHGDGRISNQYYYAQLSALTRSMKAQFPGFGDEVDAVVQKTTGVVPANALRNAILENLDRNATKEQKANDELIKFVKDNVHLTDPNTRRQINEAIASGQDLKKFYPSVFAQSTEVSAKEAQVKRENAEFVRLEHEGKATGKLATEAFTRRATDVRGIAFREAIESVGGPDSKLMKALSGEITLSAQETEGLGMLAEKLEQSYRQALDKVLDSRDQSGKSLRERIPTTELDNLIAGQMAPITALKNAITNDKTGLAGHFTRILTTQESQKAGEIRKQFPVAESMAALQKAGVPKEIIQQIYQSNQEIFSDVVRATRETLLPRVVLGQATVGQLLEELKKGGANKRPEYHDALDRITGILASPGETQAKYNTARALFATNNIVDKFPGKNFEKGSAGDGAQVFIRMMRPDVAASIKKLDEKHPGIYNQYRDWALTNFQYAARQLGNNVGANMDNQFVKFEWDANSNQFIPKATKEAEQFLSNRGIRGENVLKAISQQNSSAMRTLMAVDELNKALLVVNPLMEENNTTTTQAMQTLFKSWGIKENVPQPGFFETLFGAVKRGAPKPKEGEDLSPGLQGVFGTSPTVNFQKPSSGNEGAGGITLDGGKVTPKGTPDLTNLDRPTKELLQGLADDGVVDEIRPTSGYRDPERNARAGGAKASKHLEGKAIDLDVSHMTDEQKAKVLEAAIARGAKGIGIYPGGRSIHIDTRDTPATWGYSAFGKYNGVHWSEQPAWAQPALKKLLEPERRSDVNPADLPAIGAQEAMLIPNLKANPRVLEIRQRWNQRALDTLKVPEDIRTETTTKRLEYLIQEMPALGGIITRKGTTGSGKSEQTPEDIAIEKLFTRTQEFLRKGTAKTFEDLSDELQALEALEEVSRKRTKTPIIGYSDLNPRPDGKTPK